MFEDVERSTNVPKLDTHLIDGAPFDLFGLPVTPVPVMHGKLPIHGFRFGNAAYLTDHSEIPDSSLSRCSGMTFLACACAGKNVTSAG